MCVMKKLIYVLVLTTCALAAEDDFNKSARPEHKKSLNRDCDRAYSTTCMKLDLVSWIDKLNEADDYGVLPGVSVVREMGVVRSTTADIVAELARDFPDDPDARLDAFLLRKITGYLSSHSVRMDLWDAGETGRGKGGGGGGLGGGGGGGGKGGGMGMLIAAGVMLKGAVLALTLGGIAAIAGKALMAGLVSLVISAVIGLKSLTHHGHKQTSYEVRANPVYTHSNVHSVSHEEHGGNSVGGGSSGGGGYEHSLYGRSLDIILPKGLQPDYKLP